MKSKEEARLEDKPEEELLQLLVGKVDAELLISVHQEALEPVHVEQPNEVALGIELATESQVNLERGQSSVGKGGETESGKTSRHGR